MPSSAKVRRCALQVADDRLPDVLELVLDHAGGRRELVGCVERVEQPPLDAPPRYAGVVALQPVLDRVLELGERLQAERLGESVVDADRAGRRNGLRRHLEDRVLPGEVLLAGTSWGRWL